MNLVIDAECKQIIPALQPGELAELEQSLIKEGCRDALVIWAGQNILLDGHHRYELCQKHNIPFRTVEMEFNSREDAMVWVIQNQFARRNINAYQRSVLALKLEEIFARKAKERQATSTGGAHPQLKQNSAEAAIDTREELAKVARVSHDTIARVKKIKEKASPKEKAQLESGSMSINEAYRAIKSKEKLEKRKVSQKRIAELSPLNGEYTVLVVDPPWPYGRSEDETHRARNPYPSMSIDEIKATKLPAADDSILWLWTTNAYLHEAFHLMEVWGFSYKITLTWVKNKIGLGDWLRGQTEHCLIGVKGEYRLIPGNNSTVLFANSTKHSEKPDSFYELVNRLCPGNKKDVFGRKKRDGWDIWGPDSDTIQKEQ